MQNIDDAAGQKKIRFSPDALDLHVVGQNGKQLPVANAPYGGTAPTWEPTLVPYGGITRLQISLLGLGFRPTDKAIINIGPSKAWVIPQDDSTYWLSGKMTVEKQTGDHRPTDWSGVLELPKVEIPKRD